MTQNANQNGHGDEILDLMMRENDLFAVCTQFKPKWKKWNGKHRLCNATYMPKQAVKRPTKLDYICMSNRWKSMVINSKTRWGPSIHRFGQAFDHGLLSATWRWKTKRKKKTKARNYAALTENQSWPEFDTALRIKLQKEEEPRRYEKEPDNEALDNRYSRFTSCVYETIQEIVPERKWLKKNDRVVSQGTKALFEDRAKEYNQHPPSVDMKCHGCLSSLLPTQISDLEILGFTGGS